MQRTRSTFMVEAMLILACVVVVLAVVMSLFAFAHRMGMQSAEEQQAVTLAQNAAERFAADPKGVPEAEEADGFQVLVGVEAQDQVAGELMVATISVQRDGREVYALQTERYVAGFTADDAETADVVEAEVS